MHDTIGAVEFALAEVATLAGRPLVDLAPRDQDGHVQRLVTDNGGPSRSFRFEALSATHPELRHVRTRVRSPDQNGGRERGFGSLEYERLFLEEIDSALGLVDHAESYRVEYNNVRPAEPSPGIGPADVRRPRRPPQLHLRHPEDLPTA